MDQTRRNSSQVTSLIFKKAWQASNCITCLKDETGTKHHSDDAILNVARNFL